jgi:pilus assembly protein CpaF
MTDLLCDLEPLRILNEQIAHHLMRLSDRPAEPTTISFLSNTFNSEPGSFDGDHQTRAIVTNVCATASAEISYRIQSEYFGNGPLESLLQDPDVTEIIVNGGDSIWFEKMGKLSRWQDRFLSKLTYRNFIARLSREAGILTSLDCPFGDGSWNNCRVHLITPPASGDEAVLTLRRHPLNPWTLERLDSLNWANPHNLCQLKELIANKRNFLVIGSTGSGKTSVLNACLATLPTDERAVIIEDTSELVAPNQASTKLLTRRDAQGLLKEIDLTDLLRQALRMRPDRIIMGEVRGSEAKDLLMAFATGHSGCMGTMHADTARQALLRLEMLIQLGAPQWSLHAVRMLILLSLHAVVVVTRTPEGTRRLEGIYKITSLEDIGFLIEKS